MNKAKQDYLNAINEAWGSKEEQSSNKDEQNTTNITVVPINELARLNKLKLNKKKQIIFLSEYAKTFNITNAAYKAGVSRRVIYKTMTLDAEFKDKVQDVKDAFLDTMEQSSVYVGSQQDARGFNDRKLQLTTHRPEIYAPRPEIQTNIQVNIESSGEVKSILSKILPND